MPDNEKHDAEIAELLNELQIILEKCDRLSSQLPSLQLAGANIKTAKDIITETIDGR